MACKHSPPTGLSRPITCSGHCVTSLNRRGQRRALGGHRANVRERLSRPFVFHLSFSPPRSDKDEGVIGPSEGGHWANVNERLSMTLLPHWSLWKSIEPKEGGALGQATRGSPLSWPTGSGDCQVVARLRATTRFRRRNSSPFIINRFRPCVGVGVQRPTSRRCLPIGHFPPR